MSRAYEVSRKAATSAALRQHRGDVREHLLPTSLGEAAALVPTIIWPDQHDFAARILKRIHTTLYAKLLSKSSYGLRPVRRLTYDWGNAPLEDCYCLLIGCAANSGPHTRGFHVQGI
jgi:hypothetical protein